MKVALIPREPDAAANDRWPSPAGRVLSLVHPGPRRVSDAATVRRELASVSRNVGRNVR